MPLSVCSRVRGSNVLLSTLAVTAATLACSAKTTTTTPGSNPAMSPVTATEVRPQAPPSLRCEDVTCWRKLIARAGEEGRDDVAAAIHAQVFAREPNEANLRAWLDGLIATGQVRAAHQAIVNAKKLAADDPALTNIVDSLAASLPKPSAPQSLKPQRLPAAYTALANGDLQAAISLYQQQIQHGADHGQLEHLGTLLRAQDPKLAAQTWAKARVAVDERGGTMRIEVVDTWSTQAAMWVGQHLVLVRSYDARDYVLDIPVSRVEFWRPGTQPTLDYTYLVNGITHGLAMSEDGKTMIRATNKGVQLHEVYSGESVASFALGGRRMALETAGVGPQARILIAVGRGVELRDFSGKKIDDYTLEGTTPTITRVYRAGRGTRHDNILRDSPTWPVSLALTSNSNWVAIGGSDGKVRLIDRTRKKTKLLAYSWKYEERRHRGGNPDLNLPLDMRFVDGGKALVVAYRHGDVITWDTRTGKSRAHLAGACSLDEATTVVNMFNGPDDPTQTPTPEQREKCGYATTALLSDDATSVVAAGQGIRIREVKSGTSQAMIVRGDGTLIPDDMLSIADDGTLALVDLYGRPELWRGGNTLHKMFDGKAETGPTTPEMSGNTDFLIFELGLTPHMWNLRTGEKVLVGLGRYERVAAVSPDGKLAVINTRDAGELIDLEKGVAQTSWSNLGNVVSARFSAAGTHIVLDRGYQETRKVSLHNLQTGEARELNGPLHSLPIISAHAEAMVSVERNKSLHVWDPDTGEVQQTIDTPGIRALALARDGTSLVWVSGSDKPQATVTYLPLARGAREQSISIEGWPKSNCLAISPSGDEIFICTEKAHTRWHPTRDHVDTRERGYVTTDRVSYNPNGQLLFLGRYGRIDLHKNDDDMTRIGTIYPLLDGGYVATSVAGAVDGSPNASASTLTFAAGVDTWIAPGTLAWDRFSTPGLVPRLFTGENVQPPIVSLPEEAIRPKQTDN